MGKIVDINKRFWDKVKKTDTCWNWTACCFVKGYGEFNFNGKVVYAHRLSWQLHNGPIPGDKQINHTCNNRRCVNPDHLYVGTHQENMKDMIKDGTIRRGENHGMAKLTEENVKTIKWLLSLGVLQKDLAVIYEVNRKSISLINIGKNWSHI